MGDSLSYLDNLLPQMQTYDFIVGPHQPYGCHSVNLHY